MASASKKRQLTLRLDASTCEMAERVAEAKGIKLVAHIEFLVIEDLDRRGLVNEKIKNAHPA